MTNEFQIINNVNPINPMGLALTGLWFLSLCISAVSIVAAVIRVMKRKSVRVLANVNILTGAVCGLFSLATILWMLERVIEIVSAIEVQMSADSCMGGAIRYYWTEPIKAALVSAIIFGINLIIGLALCLKWKDPQQGGGEVRS